MQKSLGGSVYQQQRAEDSSDDAGENQGNEHASGNIHTAAIGATTRHYADPQGERGGGICGNGRHAAKQKRGKTKEAASAGNGVDGACKESGDEDKDSVMNAQTTFLSRLQGALRGIEGRK